MLAVGQWLTLYLLKMQTVMILDLLNIQSQLMISQSQFSVMINSSFIIHLVRFTINESTGQITTKDSLDREQQNSYIVTITATDQDPNTLARRSQAVQATITGILLL